MTPMHFKGPFAAEGKKILNYESKLIANIFIWTPESKVQVERRVCSPTEHIVKCKIL